ncbi:serine/threonine-protein kinase [Acrocarpospora catenulata]|uniref:serine/threonine-protein kinase n=1 Tax=Acrocarpospora catenulata TaxID=2836182 RepID=UPI0021BCD5E9|nr:serine/threonine-protein kinase [Acrocarpospora catenulata]
MAGDGERLVARRYRLLRRLGQGAMGVVWEGHDTLLDRPVAIKEVLLPRGLPPADLERQLLRTGREARTAARLNHRGIVAVYDVAEEDGRPWIVMELVPAPSLEQLVRQRGSLAVREVAVIGRQLLAALATAHAAGVLHRDVKPANILVSPDGRAVLTDFGIATAEGDASITQTGMITGSPAFLAPERASDGQIGPPSDLWSLGATLYAAVLGRSPFDRGETMATLAALLTEEPDFGRVHPALRPALAALLIRDPQRRATAAEADRLLAQIDAAPVPGSPRPRGRRTGLIAGVAAVAVVAGAAAVWALAPTDRPAPSPVAAASPSPSAAPVVARQTPEQTPQPSPTPTPVSLFKRYLSPAGWTIGYPRAWTGSRAEALTEWLSRDGGSHLGVEEVSAYGGQLEMLGDMEAALTRNVRDYQQLRLDRISWSYGSAAEWESVYTATEDNRGDRPWLTPGIAYHEVTRLLTVGDTAFALTWTTEKDAWDGQSGMMGKVLNSFRPRAG